MTNTLQKRYKILVSGYFGYNNIGDEAILKGLIDGIRKKSSNIDIVVLSKNPDWTMAKYNVESVNRSKISDIISAIRDCDMLVSGGGSLLQDVTSKKSILYYLAILKLALFFKKKTFIYSQGIGPISLKFNRILTKRILNKVDFINVRDNQSKRYLSDMGINRDILVTTDTVFGINKPSLEDGKELLEKLGIDKNKKNIALTIINWKGYRKRTVEEIIKTVEKIKEKEDVNIILIPFFYHVDLDIETEIYNKLKKKYDNIYLVKEYLHIERYLSLVGNMDIMLSMRLHGLIFATLMGAYPIGISYDPKIDGLMKELNRIQNHYVEDFNSDDVAKEIINAVENLDMLMEETNTHLKRFYSLTDKHNEAVIEVLKR
ncbi:polysaccharide pyruvyl transferase CsaB [Peptoniphilus stercorisuis]|uniref:Polysaccharide pyruvyl transferase CsaB n=1 Tax=Peptoniphilus stercorisuis TaxID=1436965 RepID=A0ABS4KDY8_9FIRM|nr:polysaccharide pyruvyl transferase CsaB [Peptoniphilus stercorisuis]